MSEKLKIELTKENGDRISWVSDSDEMFGFLTSDYWKICAEMYETLGYRNPVQINIGGCGWNTTVQFTPELGVEVSE